MQAAWLADYSVTQQKENDSDPERHYLQVTLLTHLHQDFHALIGLILGFEGVPCSSYRMLFVC